MKNPEEYLNSEGYKDGVSIHSHPYLQKQQLLKLVQTVQEDCVKELRKNPGRNKKRKV